MLLDVDDAGVTQWRYQLRRPLVEVLDSTSTFAFD